MHIHKLVNVTTDSKQRFSTSALSGIGSNAHMWLLDHNVVKIIAQKISTLVQHYLIRKGTSGSAEIYISNQWKHTYVNCVDSIP